MTARTMLLDLLQDQRGATAVEYGLILALICLAMLAVLQSVADNANAMWNNVSNKTTQAMANSQGGQGS